MNCCTRFKMALPAGGGGAEGADAPAGPIGLTTGWPVEADPPPPCTMLLYWLLRLLIASMVPWGGEPPALMPAQPASALMPPPTALAAAPLAPCPRAWSTNC